MTIGTAQGEVLPDFTLPDTHGTSVSSRSYYMRRIMIVGAMPSTVDTDWMHWLKQLSGDVESIPEPDAVCLVLTASDCPDLPDLNPRVKVLFDDDFAARTKLNLQSDSGEGCLIVTNRHGLIYHVSTGRPHDAGMNPRDLPEWVEFIACRCS
ncbi:MAG: hypothetical protein EA415_05900 [Sphaerobacteraceae bacterium]|nr:MAG: hypothetical protein EA415_05900 [Sphaerobacteraceae bacterium]